MDGSTALSTPVKRKSPHFISREYATLWLGQAVSNIGELVFDTALILWIATRIAPGESWAPAAVGGLLFATSLPMLVVGPIAGVFVDRWEKQSVVLRVDLLRAVLILSLLPLTGLVPLWPAASLHVPGFWQLGMIYVVVGLATACAQFFSPARTALIGTIVPEAQRHRASALSQTTQNLAIVLGPIIAGFLVFRYGIVPALLVNALSFLVSFVAVWWVRDHPEDLRTHAHQVPDFRREFREGLRFFAGSPILRALLSTLLLGMLGGGALNALDVFFVIQNLHLPAAVLGRLNGVYGIGAITGALALIVLAGRVQPARLFVLSVAALGVAFVVYARTTSLVPAALVLLLAGGTQAGLSGAMSPLVLHTTPRELVGRVASIFGPLVSLASIVSAGAAGILASTVLHGFHARFGGLQLGPIDLIFTASGLLLLAGSIYAAFNLWASGSSWSSPARDSSPSRSCRFISFP